MPTLDPRLRSALTEQLRGRDVLLARGARRVGWKLGLGRRERMGGGLVVGYLTTASVIAPGGSAVPSAVLSGDLHVDAEVCVELARDLGGPASAEAAHGAIRRCWPALELVDLSPRSGEPDSVVAGNVFHRAVAFGEEQIPLLCEQDVTVWVNAERRDCAGWPGDVPARIAAAAAILAALGESLRAGDRIITGSIVQVRVSAGDVVRAQFGEHAGVTVELRAEQPLRIE